MILCKAFSQPSFFDIFSQQLSALPPAAFRPSPTLPRAVPGAARGRHTPAGRLPTRPDFGRRDKTTTRQHDHNEKNRVKRSRADSLAPRPPSRRYFLRHPSRPARRPAPPPLPAARPGRCRPGCGRRTAAPWRPAAAANGPLRSARLASTRAPRAARGGPAVLRRAQGGGHARAGTPSPLSGPGGSPGAGRPRATFAETFPRANFARK